MKKDAYIYIYINMSIYQIDDCFKVVLVLCKRQKVYVAPGLCCFVLSALPFMETVQTMFSCEFHQKHLVCDTQV